MSQIAIGVIGTGRMAAAMVAAFKHVSGVNVVAVASSSGNRERALKFAKQFGIARPYASTAELLACSDITLVYIASPTSSHAPLSIAALKAGKAVLCEKPFATTLAEGEAVLDAARESGRFYMEGVWTPFLPAYKRTFALVSQGAIGKPTHFSASFGYPTSAKSHPDLFASIGGGVLLDRAVYPISLAIQLLGPVARTEKLVTYAPNGIDVEAALQLSHRGGGSSHLTVSLTSLLSNTAVISGPHGSITLEAPLIGSESIMVRRASSGGERPSVGQSVSAPQRVIAQLRKLEIVRRASRRLSAFKNEFHGYGGNPYVPQVHHVIARMGSGDTQSDTVSLDHSMQVLAIIDAARTVNASASLVEGQAR